MLGTTVILDYSMLILLRCCIVRESSAAAFTSLASIHSMECAGRKRVLLLVKHYAWQFVGCILLHGTVSIFVASAPDDHICLLAEISRLVRISLIDAWLHV